MGKQKKETPEDVRRWFIREVEKLWPAAKGSVAKRRNRCIHPDCRICKSGKKHLSYVLYLRKQGRYTSRHIPKDLVETMKQATAGGKRLEALLVEAGERYLKALKNEREKKR